ncbi:hypothetical protein [Methylibium sp.]|uniref:hypothetical protein n=1 Tax=Methylibium sp. TaxID=2067992 RepID=UPI003D11BFBA
MSIHLGPVGHRAGCLGLTALLCFSAGAVEPAESREPAVAPTPLALGASPLSQAWTSRAAAEVQSASRETASNVTIIELPREVMPGTAGPQRAHHALSVRSEAPQRMLRSIGIEASDCATRFRLPTKLRQDTDGTSIDVRAQIGLACRF